MRQDESIGLRLLTYIVVYWAAVWAVVAAVGAVTVCLCFSNDR